MKISALIISYVLGLIALLLFLGIVIVLVDHAPGSLGT